MRLGTLPLSTGLAVAGLPRLLGFHPGPDHLGWIAAGRDRDIRAIGAVRVSHAHRAKWAHYVTHELGGSGGRGFDSLLVVGPSGSREQAAAFARVIGAPERRTTIAEIDSGLFLASGQRIWRTIPRPADGVFVGGAAERAASWEALCRQYEVTPGPAAWENAPRLDPWVAESLDLMAPKNRFATARAVIDKLASFRPGLARDVEAVPRKVAMLSHLLTDRRVANAILHVTVGHPDKVQGLVAAHRVAHPEAGQHLRGTAAMAVYATSPTPQLALRIAGQAPEAPLSRSVERLWQERVPGRLAHEWVTSRETIEPLLAAQRKYEVALEGVADAPHRLAGLSVGAHEPGFA